MGRALMALHQQKGVQFCMEEEVAEFSGDTSLEAVLLKSDRRLKADLVVVGVGVTPATNIAGLPTDSRGETSVKSYCSICSIGLCSDSRIRRPDPFFEIPFFCDF